MQKAHLLTAVLFSSLLLAACKAPDPQTQELKFSDGAAATEQTSQGNGSTSQNYQLENTPPEVKGTSMKQLSDFTPIEGTTVTLTTTKGDITFELFRDTAPLTTLNFLTLVKEGFYDGMVFHRVIPDFMAQVGDPLTKDPAKEAMWGTGGPGYSIPDEFDPTLKHDSAGIVSMANSGANTGGSQFFITYEPTPWLDGKHAVFGKVTAGMDILEQITVGDKIMSVSYK
jgi:cyclophilin family peptidyl-prolyl cis-trans isomerase